MNHTEIIPPHNPHHPPNPSPWKNCLHETGSGARKAGDCLFKTNYPGY